MKQLQPNASSRPLPQVSPFWMQWFTAYTRRFIRRRFHSVRILSDSLPTSSVDSPAIVYLNHASWWDPLVCLLLTREYFPDRSSFAPIDAAMLERYRFFRRLGFYGVDRDSKTRGIEFIRATQKLLQTHRNMVWLTPQGEFTDVRNRPVHFQKGLGSLVRHLPEISYIPLAIEYTFWTEPRPEILIAFGKPSLSSQLQVNGADTATTILQDEMKQTQDRLAEAACRRDSTEWQILNRGSSGISTVYDGWRRLRARIGGFRFSPEHQAEHSK